MERAIRGASGSAKSYGTTSHRYSGYGGTARSTSDATPTIVSSYLSMS